MSSITVIAAPSMRAQRLQYAAVGLATAVVYVASAKLGLTLAFVAEQVTVVWPPTGISLAAVLLLGYRIWPAVAVGAFIANITTNAPVTTSHRYCDRQYAGSARGAYLLNRLVGIRPSLERFRDLFGLIFFGAIVSTMVSATIGTISLCLTGMQPWSRFGELWGVWYLGDAMGDVVFAPLVLTLFAPESRLQIRSRVSEFIALLAILTVINLFVFGGGPILGPQFHRPDYAVFPFFIWAALRFGTSGTAISVFITASIAVLGTVQGFGPFTSGGISENLISVELYMFVAAVTGLILAVSKTERDKAETSLHRSEERYRSLVLASSQVVWTANATGDVVEDLPTWKAFTGQTTENMIGRGWMQMLHPDDLEHVGRLWEQSLATGTSHENEFRVMTVDGTYRTVYARAVPVLEPDGRVREWIGTLTDVTARKTVEREMEEADKRKDEFLAMLAHELRNPLAPIRNAVEIIRLSKGDPARIDWTCEIMVRQVHHMSRLLDDLLDVSRITRGKIQLYKQSTDLKTLVERCLEPAQTIIEKKELNLARNFVPGLVPLSADPTRIEQVITNLLNNAVKFTPSGGHIKVIVERDRDWAVLRVIDNGRGIAPALLPRIFDLFTQGDGSLARSEGGLGIGLTLVQTLVLMHDGIVEAKSDGPGLGSEFVVRLPMLPVVPTESSGKSARPRPAIQKKLILVVEDNADSAETLAAMLDIMGYEPHVAHDGTVGIDEFDRLKPSVVLLDIGLPGISGYEVAKRLRARGTPVKLIALTGYGSDADRARARDAGFDHHLVKPVDFQILEKLLAEN